MALNLDVLSVIMLSVSYYGCHFKISVASEDVMKDVIMQSVVMLNVVEPLVVAPTVIFCAQKLCFGYMS